MTVCKDNDAGGCTDGSAITGTRMEGSSDGLVFATIDSGSGTYTASITSTYQDTFSFITELSVTVYSEIASGVVQMTTAGASNPAPALAPEPTACPGWCTEDYCTWEEA